MVFTLVYHKNSDWIHWFYCCLSLYTCGICHDHKVGAFPAIFMSTTQNCQQNVSKCTNCVHSCVRFKEILWPMPLKIKLSWMPAGKWWKCTRNQMKLVKSRPKKRTKFDLQLSKNHFCTFSSNICHSFIIHLWKYDKISWIWRDFT